MHPTDERMNACEKMKRRREGGEISVLTDGIAKRMNNAFDQNSIGIFISQKPGLLSRSSARPNPVQPNRQRTVSSLQAVE